MGQASTPAAGLQTRSLHAINVTLDLHDKHAAVIGIRRSGSAALQLLRAHGAHVRAIDEQPPDPSVLPQTRESLAPPLDLIVPSPGVPLDLPLLNEARASGIPVMGEVELASYFLRGPIIGITGSNGKTTTTALTGHLLRECGIACQVGGNIGTAVTALVDTSREHQWNVLELSSFQLEDIQHFHADIAVCLNVTPDHLDRHGTFENYARAKGRLFSTQRRGDKAVLNFDDVTCREFARETKADVRWFSVRRPVDLGMWLERGELVSNGQPFLRREDIRLRGLHNVENVLAAALTAHLAGAPLNAIAAAVKTFPGVEHRIEFVRTLHGVDYFNDSKATNVDATLKAIDAFDRGLWIILGGKDKGSDYRPLREPLHQKARAALLIGAARPLIRSALEGALPLVDCETLDKAVSYARRYAKPGDTVLLAPACASFDQFANYEERGKRFKQLVQGSI